MWNPFRFKSKKVVTQDLVLTCPPQQLITRRCVCIGCEKRGTCYTEGLIASDNNCENQWISACSLLKSNRENTVFNSIFGEYYEALKRRYR